MVNLQVKRSVKLALKKSILIHAAQLTLDSENAPANSEISIVLADDALLREYNFKFRHIDGPTDVLSFPTTEPDPDTKSTYLGDVIISLPRAEEQAIAGGHALADELRLLVVHGTLHLLNHDHLGARDKSKMQSAQDRILQQLGVILKISL